MTEIQLQLCQTLTMPQIKKRIWVNFFAADAFIRKVANPVISAHRTKLPPNAEILFVFTGWNVYKVFGHLCLVWE